MLMHMLRTFLLPLLFTAAQSDIYARSVVPVFLMSGQSNMVGTAPVSGLSDDEKASVENVMINVNGACDNSKKGTWLTLGTGFGSEANTLGPELSFGRILADSMPDCKIAIIKSAMHTSALGTTDEWIPPSSNGGKAGPYYRSMMQNIAGALESFHTAFDTSLYTPGWAGFVWLQGESDAMDKTLAESYKENLRNLINDIRDTLDVPDLPVIIPLITTFWAQSSLVRGAGITMALEDGNIDTMETDMLERHDGLHYDASGNIVIGETVARKWLAMEFHQDNNVSVGMPQIRFHNADVKEMLLVDLTGRSISGNPVSFWKKRSSGVVVGRNCGLLFSGVSTRHRR